MHELFAFELPAHTSYYYWLKKAEKADIFVAREAKDCLISGNT